MLQRKPRVMNISCSSENRGFFIFLQNLYKKEGSTFFLSFFLAFHSFVSRSISSCPFFVSAASLLPSTILVYIHLVFVTWPPSVLEERGGGGGGRVKRFTPSNAKLCNRNFLIRFTVEGKKREFILKMQNQPQCRLLLSDKAGEPIKEIRTSKIKYVQKQNVVRTSCIKEKNSTGRLSILFCRFHLK